MAILQASSFPIERAKKRKRNPQKPQNDGQSSSDAMEAHSVQMDSRQTGYTIVPTKTQDGGSKPRRTTGRNKPGLERRSSSGGFVETSIPWPEHFTRLAQTHRALNLVYTFCCTRKHFATTFDNIKSTVETHTRRELLIEEIAQIKALLPQAITFEYVSESQLQVSLIGAEQGNRSKWLASYPPLDQLGGTTAENDTEVLLFEFDDGDLKRQVRDPKTGEATNPTDKLRREKLRMPVYSQKNMMTMIDKRNTKFTSAVNELLNNCAEEERDAVQAVVDLGSAYMPMPSGTPRSNTPKPEGQAGLPPDIPVERKSIPEIIAEIKSLDWYSGQIVPDGHRVFDPQEPIYGELKFSLSQSLVNALYNTRSITQFYAHQAEAINNLYDGHNVIVSTSTSSGKSLIYQVPVLHELEQNPDTRAMYIFPTKALAQDQRRSLKDLLHYMDGLQHVIVETFDGDTDMKDRRQIREEGRIIFTNPDMLHITILPQEESWRTFLKNLKYVVVDELHVYNGLFGSHVSFIMRRLRRVCNAIGNRHVKFISCSATVSNPEEHMKTIFGVDEVKLTDFDGSPSGRKEFVCWNTPFKDPGDPTSGRGDAMTQAAKLFCQLMLRGVRVIAFAKIRRGCELLLNCVKAELTALERPQTMCRVMGYRGGYNPQDRRRIEREMFEGKLVGIIATNALELGIDIGSLDAVISVGFPYTIANLRQQSGRAGRRNKDSLSVLLGDCFPSDQYYMDNPDEIFTRPNCEVQVDLNNLLVLEGHIQCAAFEMPIQPDEDRVYFGEQLKQVAEERMVKDSLGFYHCHDRFRPHPSKFVGIRDTENDHFAIVDITNGRNEIIEDLEASRAFFTIYEGGIFLNQGNTYLVKTFAPDRMLAEVEKVKVDWITQQRDYTNIDPVEVEAIRSIPNSLSRAFHGSIRITAVVFGFFKIDKRRRILDAVEVENPPVVIFSKGMWLDVPKEAVDILNSRRLNVAGAIHAAEHAILSLLPNYVVSMPDDVRTECKNALKEFAKKPSQRKRPARLTFYDAKGGASGSGISTKAFEFIDLLLKQALERVLKCHCIDGCLECCCSERCKEANQVMSKAGSEVILKSLLNMEIDVDALPWGPEERVPAGIETVIYAEEVRPKKGRVVEVIQVKREGGGTRQVVVDSVHGEDDTVHENGGGFFVGESADDVHVLEGDSDDFTHDDDDENTGVADGDEDEDEHDDLVVIKEEPLD